MLKACSRCGGIRGRCPCPQYVRPYGTPAYRRARATLLAQETVCWLCDEPGTPDDPLTADHVVEVANGGDSSRSNLRAAHLSCNSRRGQALQEGVA